MYNILSPCTEDTCHCNFLYNIHDCKESKELKILMTIGLVIATINSIVGIGIVIHRLYFQSQKIFDNKRISSFPLKPRPIDCLFLFSTIFSVLWVVDFIILLTDAFPNLIILRSFLFNFPLQLTTANCALYMLSLLQQFSQIRIKIPKLWYIPALSWLEYYCGIVLIVIPFILHNIFIVFIGFLLTSTLSSSSTTSSTHFINNSNNNSIHHSNIMARLLTRLHFGIWSFVLISLLMIYFYSLHRLHQLYPNTSLKRTKSSSTSSSSLVLQTSFYRNQLYLWILTICIGIFVLLFLFYSLFMDQILLSSWCIVFYCATWIFFPLLTQFLLEVVFILKPQLIIQSMLKIKGLEDYQVNNDPIDDHHQQQQQQKQFEDDDDEKNIHTNHTIVSHISSSIRLSSSIDYETLEHLYTNHHHHHHHHHVDYNVDDNNIDNININRKESLLSSSFSLSSTLYSPPSFPLPLHLYDIQTISTINESNTSY